MQRSRQAVGVGEMNVPLLRFIVVVLGPLGILLGVVGIVLQVYLLVAK